MSTTDKILLGYFLIGVLYWTYNLIFRKLHTKNEPGDGWTLVPLWLFGWPICFIVLFSIWITDKKFIKTKNKI